jgi:hypothetical protein
VENTRFVGDEIWNEVGPITLLNYQLVGIKDEETGLSDNTIKIKLAIYILWTSRLLDLQK